MFTLKKLITPFLLPPGLFILILGAIGLWGLHKRNRLTAIAAFVIGGLIWLLSLSPTANLVMTSLERGIAMPANPDADVILLLGGSIYAKAPDYSGIGAPGPGTMERLVTAVRLHRDLGVPIVVSGGRVFKTRPATIAELAKRFLIDLGVPAEMIIAEDHSRDTYENALYCKEICIQNGFTKPLVVTSGYHIKRALVSFDKVGMAVTAFPCALTTWPDRRYGWHHFLPSSGAMRSTAMAMHEWIGLIYYKLIY